MRGRQSHLEDGKWGCRRVEKAFASYVKLGVTFPYEFCFVCGMLRLFCFSQAHRCEL